MTKRNTLFPKAMSGLVLAILLVLCTSGNAKALGDLTWYYFNFPPMFIVEQGQPPKGFGIQIMEALWTDMPGYNHRMEELSPDIMMEKLAAGEHGLALGMLRSDMREQVMAFNQIPCRLSSPTMIAMLEDEARSVAPSGFISLKAILSNTHLKYAEIKGMSYGQLQPILDEHRNLEKTQIFTSSPSLVAALISGEADWAIVDPLVIPYLQKQFNGTKLSLVKIKENPDSFAPGYIAGPKNDWAKQVLKHADMALLTLIQNQHLYSILKESVPAQLKNRFQNAYKRQINDPVMEPLPLKD
ncbi:transporter substrate-binding domain-containing protein [Pseudodesulfovibrio sp. zrk46]|uniref:transporter substrate-binding domain-containing protein n=1 Tax=Pseudodesulfovibrio sp. zrk46 TaxID=2725288 RepID=UPI001449D372|nr:transporter substrate-binding domain-containing protein [Pseudodesulfovibrio sp. zrk46]QJB58270.1 transporter substrate-binding domain-containing protein [Pseudodesulfovibrio sp. zrk46]